MTWELLVVVMTVSFLGMIAPGPDFFLVVKNSLNYPRKYAIMTYLGILLAILTHMSYCVAGIAVIIKTTPWLFTLLRYAGAVYLIWLGYKALITRVSGTVYLGQDRPANSITAKKAFLQGYLCNLLNPKATLFFLAIFTQVLDLNSSLFDKLAVAMIIVIEAIIWWPIVIVVFQSPVVQRGYYKMQFIVDKLLGIILIGLGIKVALSF